MILKRLLAGSIAVGASLAASGVVVVAAAFALYAFLKVWTGPAGASALTALVFALVAGIGAVVGMSIAKGKKVHKPKRGAAGQAEGARSGVSDRLIELARERPLAAAGAAVAAGLLALRNPALVGVVTRIFTEPRRNAGR